MNGIKRSIKLSYLVAKVFAFVFDIAIDAMSVFPVIDLLVASSFSFPPIPPDFVSSSLRVDPVFLNHRTIMFDNEIRVFCKWIFQVIL